MINAANIPNVQFYSGYDTFKNFSSNSGSIVVPTDTYAPGTFQVFSTTISLERQLAATQILHNFSQLAAQFYIGNYIQVDFVGGYSVQIRAQYAATTMSVDVYVVNQSPAPVNVTTFTVNTTIRRFLTPF